MAASSEAAGVSVALAKDNKCNCKAPSVSFLVSTDVQTLTEADVRPRLDGLGLPHY